MLQVENSHSERLEGQGLNLQVWAGRRFPHRSANIDMCLVVFKGEWTDDGVYYCPKY